MNFLKLREGKAGYEVLHKYAGWRAAFITYSPRFDSREKNLLERHLLTDEIFILLKGKADLYIGEKACRQAMKKGEMYVIKAGEWHSVALSKRAKVAVFENIETGKENSEYKTFQGEDK